MPVPAPIKKVVFKLAEKSSLVRRGVDGYREWKLIRRHAGRKPVSDQSFGLLNLELTNKCPMRCVMCARTNNMEREQGLMAFETFKAIIDEYVARHPSRAANEDTWLHHFGESLVHPEYARFVRYAVEKGVHACMSINPIMLTPNVADELLATGIKKLYISLDGHDDESFLAIRGVKDAYEKSKAHLLDFLKKKIERQCETHIVLSMIDFKLNRESIARQRGYWESIPGIDEVLCKNFVTWNGDAADVNQLADMQVDNTEVRKKHKMPSCNVPWETMSVTWDGIVVPCCYDYDKKYPLGDLKKETLADVWNGERMLKLRQEFIDNKVDNPLCRRCQVLYPSPNPADVPAESSSAAIGG